MTNLLITGELESYDEFYAATRKPARKTEQAQRAEIERNLETLTAQHDYWALDVIRKLTKILTEDNNDAASKIYLYVRDLVSMGDPCAVIYDAKKAKSRKDGTP